MPATNTRGQRSPRVGNRAQILVELQRAGVSHRAELARRTGTSRTTVSSIVAELIDEDLVVELADDAATSADKVQAGRPGDLLALNPSAGVLIGVDISYGNLHAIATDLSHRVLAERVIPREGAQSPQQVLATAAEAIRDALTENDFSSSRVLGVGLGVPGPVDVRTSSVARSSHSAHWADVNVADELSEDVGYPVFIENTAHLAALGETEWGAASGSRHVLYVKLETGIGAGLTLNGEIYQGSIGVAGELGHFTVDESGPACRCGNRGCLEAYAGMFAIRDALTSWYGHAPDIDEVLTAAAQGDRATQRVIADAGHRIGSVLASVCNLLNPEMIVVGGSLSEAGDVLMAPLRDAVGQRSLAVTADAVTIVKGALGARAGALGAVALVLRHPSLLGAAT